MIRLFFAALAASLLAPISAKCDPVTVTMTGTTTYFHRVLAEVPGVPEAEQADYQSSWAGEMGLRISGLRPEPYRVRLDYTEMDMNAPRARVFDILLNGTVVKKEVCIFNAVGNRRVLTYSFTVTPRNGVITFLQRRSVRQADNPSFTLIRLYDASGKLALRRSAYDLRPPDWPMRDYLDEIYRAPRHDNRTWPPWPGTYKISPDQASRLTADDVVGPDGIVYPNWTHVGIPGGIPVLPVSLSAADFGLIPGGNGDSSAALQRAIDALQARGGGVLFIPEGRYYLDRPIFVTADNCVLRGAGSKKTRLISRFSMHGRAPEFGGIPGSGLMGPSSSLSAWVDPEGATGVTLSSGPAQIKTVKLPGLWGTGIQFSFAGQLLLNAIGAGPADLTIVVSYRNGTERRATTHVELSASEVPGGRPYASLGMINFLGAGFGRAPKLLLTSTAKRGDTSLELPSGHGLAPGDRILIVGPETFRWSRILRTRKWNGPFRSNEYDVTAVNGTRISIPEALRLEFPVEDGSYVQKLRPIIRCGIEDLGFEQVVPTQVHAINFIFAWECWARGVEVVRTGDKPLYMPDSKRCEARDCVFDRSWCNDGGSAYSGWESSYDCLMENVTTYDLRHAPVYQWASSGSVIRNSVFHGSDMQWHAGWCNENLDEGLTVESSQVTGAYGNGGWSSGPDDSAHGPNGPRNVVYNCNLTSVKTGLWLGGMNENWLILYNRFVVGHGPAVFAKEASFDHIIRGNVFVMQDPWPAAIYLATPDCTGIELTGNRFYGPPGPLFGGPIQPAVDQDNWIGETGGIDRPRPAIRSIYEWEQAHQQEIEAAAAKRRT